MIRSRLVPIAAALLAAAFLVAVALPDHRGDGTYYTASRLLLTGQFGPQAYEDDWMRAQIEVLTAGRVSDIFRPNPPTAALLALPVAWLPPAAARRAWAALNTLLLYGALALPAACPSGVTSLPIGTNGRPKAPPQAGRAGGAGRLLLLLALAFGLFAAPVVEGFQLGQAYILLLALYVLAWWGMRTRRSALLGLSLAVAMMLKTSGGPLWLLLALRREWRALAWAAVGCAFIFGLSLPWIGLDTWFAYQTDVLPSAAASPSIAVTAFQSLPGFLAHLFRYDPQWNPAPLVNVPGLAGQSGLMLSLALLAITLAVARLASPGLAFGMMAAASVFVVPYAEQHHYTLMALPVSLALAAWAETRPRTEGALLLFASLLMALPLPYESSALAVGWLALLAYPRLYGGLLLWGVLLRLALRPWPYADEVRA